MNFYQMSPQKIAEELNSDLNAGKINEDISNKEKEQNAFVSLMSSVLQEAKSSFSFLDLLPLICYLIALVFSVFNTLFVFLFEYYKFTEEIVDNNNYYSDYNLGYNLT